jgi:hypothetical protein
MAAGESATRSKDIYFLLDFIVKEFNGSKLPSKRDALGVFIRRHIEEKQTIRESAANTIRDLIPIWTGQARIPVRPEHRAIMQLEALFQTWKDLKRLRNRRTPAQIKKEKTFVDNLDDLFDISHANALDMIVLQEDKEFLLAQREKGRRGCMGSVDKALTAKEERIMQKRKAEEMRKKKAEEECKASTSNDVILASSSSTEDGNSTDGSMSDETEEPHPKRSRARQNIVTPSLAAALDRTQVSDRKATMILTETAISLGHDPKTLAINRMTIARSRQKARATFVQNIKKEFHANEPLTVHWDGKLLKDLTSNKHVDRLPILLSGLSVSRLLGVPKLTFGTGEAQARAIIDALQEWGVSEAVAAMCFDTTAANTGRRNGTCVLLEQKLGRDLLYLACRHHVMELLLAAAFEATMGGTSGPDVLLFKRFQGRWESIDPTSFEPGITEESVSAVITDDIRNQTLKFATDQLEKVQPRDDYLELLELAMIFLGNVPPRGVKFRAPGPVHHARWMSKLLYAFKIWMFRKQFRLTAKEEKALKELCIFGILVYIEAWFTAPNALEAPRRDLTLIKSLLQLPNAAISKATSDKMSKHLWYLSEELVALAFFDDAVPSETKQRMIAKLQGEDDEDEPLKRPQYQASFLKEKHLEDFVTPKTMRFFKKLRLDTNFLNEDPSSWLRREGFQSAQAIVRSLKVVNDNAERGVALVQSYNRLLTKDEEQLQFLLQLVSEHRRVYPDVRKGTLIKPREQ